VDTGPAPSLVRPPQTSFAESQAVPWSLPGDELGGEQPSLFLYTIRANDQGMCAVNLPPSRNGNSCPRRTAGQHPGAKLVDDAAPTSASPCGGGVITRSRLIFNDCQRRAGDQGMAGRTGGAFRGAHPQ